LFLLLFSSDLLESGKRHTHLSEPIKSTSSPTHSPIPIRGQRIFGSSTDSPSASPRLPHTLPNSSVQEQLEEDSPVIPRRPTYPLSNRLKGEKSAFKPVVIPNEIATSTSSLASTSSQSQPSISTPPPASNPMFSVSPSFPVSPHTISTTTATPSSVTTASACTSRSTTSLVQTSSSAYSVTSEHRKDSTLTPDGAATLSNTRSETQPQVIASGRSSLVSSRVSEAPSATVAHGLSSSDTPQSTQQDGTLTRANGAVPVSVKSTSVVTSPTTSVTSPLFTATVTRSHSSQVHTVTPSPPHSCTSTPRQVYSPSVSQLMYGPGVGMPPYSPATQLWYPGSPLPSPIPSPKTPKMNKMYGSAIGINRTPTEYDSLLKWLKSHRLHKYHQLFESMTFEEVRGCSLAVVCSCVWKNGQPLKCRLLLGHV